MQNCDPNSNPVIAITILIIMFALAMKGGWDVLQWAVKVRFDQDESGIRISWNRE